MPTKFGAKTITRDPAMLGPAVHPGEMLREEFLKPLRLTQVEAAGQLGLSTNRLNELIRGKRGVTADTALRLARRFETTPQLWLPPQAAWDLRPGNHPPRNSGHGASRHGRSAEHPRAYRGNPVRSPRGRRPDLPSVAVGREAR